jgi:hypothetical protein
MGLRSNVKIKTSLNCMRLNNLSFYDGEISEKPKYFAQ